MEIVLAVLEDPDITRGWGYPQPALLLDETEAAGATEDDVFFGSDGEFCVPPALLRELRPTTRLPARLPIQEYPSRLRLYSRHTFDHGFWSRHADRYISSLEYYVNVVSVSTPTLGTSQSEALVGLTQYSPRTGCSLAYVVYVRLISGTWVVVATGGLAIS